MLMIPKKIHYCWFGRGEKPNLAKKCIQSWKTHCPDYELIEWNEDTFNVNHNAYTKWCYDTKKYAFLSDYVRLLAVYQHGGVYFDTDVEVLRNLDFLLNNQAFFGFETSGCVASGLGFGSVVKGVALDAMLKEYDKLKDGKHGVIMCPELNTLALKKLGLNCNGTYQKFSWGTVYPINYFNPYESTTGRLNKSHDTVSIHWYMGSCLTLKQKLRSFISRPLHRMFGVEFMRKMKK